MKRIIIFDLDATAIDSSHRTPNHPDGTLNLPLYLSMKNRENTFLDSLLPLADFWRNLDRSKNHVWICTARNWADFDQEFLNFHGLFADKILHRASNGSENNKKDAKLKRVWLQRLFNLKQYQKLPKFMFDDANSVITEMRQMGIVCLNSLVVNKRLESR